jgi:hypothetical protein
MSAKSLHVTLAYYQLRFYIALQAAQTSSAIIISGKSRNTNAGFCTLRCNDVSLQTVPHRGTSLRNNRSTYMNFSFELVRFSVFVVYGFVPGIYIDTSLFPHLCQ